MEGTYAAEMPDWQFRTRLSSLDRRRALTNEPFEQRIHGNTLSPGFVGETRFDFMRYLNAHLFHPSLGYRIGWFANPRLHRIR
jgi:hypothetical protein